MLLKKKNIPLLAGLALFWVILSACGASTGPSHRTSTGTASSLASGTTSTPKPRFIVFGMTTKTYSVNDILGNAPKFTFPQNDTGVTGFQLGSIQTGVMAVEALGAPASADLVHLNGVPNGKIGNDGSIDGTPCLKNSKGETESCVLSWNFCGSYNVTCTPSEAALDAGCSIFLWQALTQDVGYTSTKLANAYILNFSGKDPVTVAYGCYVDVM